MNIAFFMDELKAQIPPGKELTAAQHVGYRDKLRRFSDAELDKLYDSIIENCKYFPKIADIYEQARNLGMFNKELEYKPHVWEPTDCNLCGGSGLMAAFYSQEFAFAPDTGKTQTIRLTHVCPYHTSGPRFRSTEDEIRYSFRCFCFAGEAVTLDHGIPRWSKDKPLVIERKWG